MFKMNRYKNTGESPIFWQFSGIFEILNFNLYNINNKLLIFFIFRISYFTGVILLSFNTTSWAPPSTILTDDTRVSLALLWNSGMLKAPQLHMVERTLLSVMLRLSWRLPAYGT